MDGSRFAAWTRRNFGLTAAAVVAALLGRDAETDAKRKHKKRRRKNKKRAKKRRKRQCEQLNTRCNPNNDRKTCCAGLYCSEVPELGGHHCCRWRFGACESDADCCGQLTCSGAPGGFCDVSGL